MGVKMSFKNVQIRALADALKSDCVEATTDPLALPGFSISFLLPYYRHFSEISNLMPL